MHWLDWTIQETDAAPEAAAAQAADADSADTGDSE